MKLCPKCKSDSLEMTSSPGLRVLACIVLLFIPFGIFLCWLPFVLPHSYRCRICGAKLEAGALLELDWRERDVLMEKHRLLEAKLAPLAGAWLKDQDGTAHKIVQARGQFLLLQLNKHRIDPLRVVEYMNSIGQETLLLSDSWAAELEMIERSSYSTAAPGTKLADGPAIVLTELGQQLLTEPELQKMGEGNDILLEWLEENGPLPVIVLTMEETNLD